MKKGNCIVFTFVFIFGFLNTTISASGIDGAKALLLRLIPSHAASFTLQEIPKENDRDVFEVSASGGSVLVKGSSGVALCRGIYDYLRNGCNCMVGWAGVNLDLPSTLPNYSRKKVVTPYKFLLFNNVVTYGYSSANWDWARWEQELDWMALHGINMMMAPVATEAIWQRVWNKWNISNAALDAFFCGPCFLPWHRMGNINNFQGPLSDNWHTDRIALQKQILARMRALDIIPIAPGFSGYVPKEFGTAYPDATLIKIGSWCSFPAQYNTQILDPNSQYFAQLGKDYITEWKNEFGEARYYISDTFNEVHVPIQSDKLKELADYGEAIYEGVKAGDPDGVWIMQAWLFLSDAGFWDKSAVQAYLSKVPNDKMLILDLATDNSPQWSKYDAFFGKQWLNSNIPNFGGCTPLAGNLPFYASTPIDILNSSSNGNLVGFGASPEGVDNNEVVYELLTDMGWQSTKINLDTWIPQYCTSRYGSYPNEIKMAWDKFRNSIYDHRASYFCFHVYQSRPGKVLSGGHLYSFGGIDESQIYRDGVDQFLSVSDQFKDNQLYFNDAIELAVQRLGIDVDERLRGYFEADQAGVYPARDKFGVESVDMIKRMDGLLEAHPTHRLSVWTDWARAWGHDATEKDHYEAGAKLLVTQWGVKETSDRLNEYGAKVWSGLLRDYYAGRWENYLHAYSTGTSWDRFAWEQEVIKRPGLSTPVVYTEPLAKAKVFINITRNWDWEQDMGGQKIGTWVPTQMSTSYTTIDWDFTQDVTTAGKYHFTFKYTSGTHRLDIQWAALLEDGVEIDRDTHNGSTGTSSSNNSYALTLPKVTSGATYVLRASVRSDGGTDSNGDVMLFAPAATAIVEQPAIPLTQAVNRIRLVKTGGTHRLYVPFLQGYTLTLYSLQGKALATFTTQKERHWYSIDRVIGHGTYALLIHSARNSFVKKIAVVR